MKYKHGDPVWVRIVAGDGRLSGYPAPAAGKYPATVMELARHVNGSDYYAIEGPAFPMIEGSLPEVAEWKLEPRPWGCLS
jgi:hypothetical protein